MSPVMVALAAKLNVAGLTNLFSGDPVVGVYDDIPQDARMPFVWIEIPDESNEGVMGEGEFGMPKPRIHVFDDYEGTRRPQLITAKVIELLKHQSLTISGYTQAGQVFYERTQLLNDTVFHGRKCREMVSFFNTYVMA